LVCGSGPLFVDAPHHISCSSSRDAVYAVPCVSHPCVSQSSDFRLSFLFRLACLISPGGVFRFSLPSMDPCSHLPHPPPHCPRVVPFACRHCSVASRCNDRIASIVPSKNKLCLRSESEFNQELLFNFSTPSRLLNMSNAWRTPMKKYRRKVERCSTKALVVDWRSVRNGWK